MKRSAISRAALWTIIAVVVVVAVVGGVAAWYVTRPPPPKPTPTPTPTPTHAIVGQVTIGVATDLTGAYGPVGEQVLWGAQLAASQINSRGGIYLANGPDGPGNYTINLVWTDDQTNPSVGPTALLQLYTTYHPAAVIGSIATEVVDAELPVIQQYGIPYFSQAAQTTTLTVSPQNFTPILSHDMVFHDEDTAYYFGWLTAEFLLQYKDEINPNGPLRVAGVTYSNNPVFMVDDMGGFEAAIRALGAQNEIQVVDVETTPSPSSTELQPILARFAQENVDVIITGLTPPAAAAAVQQAAAFPQLKGAVGIIWTPEDDPSWYKIVSGPDVNYMHWFVFSNFPSMCNTSNQQFNSRMQYYRDQYLALAGRPLGAIGSFGIDNLYLIAAGLQAAGTTNSSALISALQSLTPSQVPWPLANDYATFQPGNTLFGPPSSGIFWHSTNQSIVFMQMYYNSTSNSVYTQVVWPPSYATAQPSFGG
ncbi:MAG: ABC transporter substrate-binding protein [Nitrososphaeria archaeon]